MHYAFLPFKTVVMLAFIACSGHAAFIVEVHESGLGFDNFEYGGETLSAGTSIPSTAIGLTGTNSIFGGNGLGDPDTYVFSYRPGRDDDNFAPRENQFLGSKDGSIGNRNRASGLVGGMTGTYNVYITSPASSNVGGDSLVTITQDGEPIELEIDMNNEGTGPDSQGSTNLGFVGGMNNAWHLLTSIDLTADATYTVTMEAIVETFVSQRVHAVMWERVSGSSLAGDFNGDQLLDSTDVDELSLAIREMSVDSTYDLNLDDVVDGRDLSHWVQQLKSTWFGDANLDGQFDDVDLVSVFIAGEYVDGQSGNSGWATGDWNADREFDELDFVSAFIDGGYLAGERGAIASAVPEPTACVLLLPLLVLLQHRKSSWRWTARPSA